MTLDEETRLLALAHDKLEIAAAALARFVATGSPARRRHPRGWTVEDYRQLAGMELEVRHAKAAIHDIRRARAKGSLCADLVAACIRLFDAPHQEHFAARLNDEELAALNAIRATIVKIAEDVTP